MTTPKIAQIENPEDRKKYGWLLQSLQQSRLVEPGQDRYLTDEGKRFMAEVLDEDPLVGDKSNLEFMVNVIKNLRQVGATGSEVDAFIYDAANVIFDNSEEIYRENISAHEESKKIASRGTYLLAGIDVLNTAVDIGLLINDAEHSNGQSRMLYRR